MSNSAAKLLAKGSVLRTSLFIINIFAAFFLMPFIVHSLGDRMYGLWAVIGSFLGFYGLFDFGLSSAVQRYLSRAIGSKDYNEANSVISSSIFIYSFIGILVLFFSLIAAFIAPLFLKNINDASLFSKIIIILGINAAISFPMRVFLGIMSSHLRYDLSTFVHLLQLILRVTLVVIFLNLGFRILALAIITFSVNMFGHLIFLFMAKKVGKYVVFSKKFIRKENVKVLFKYSKYTFVNQIADKVRFNIDNFVIAGFLGLNFVTLYAIAARIICYFIEFMISALDIFKPVFSQYEAKGDYESIREKFVFTTKLSGYLSVLIGGILIIFGRPFIAIWMGEKYVEAYPLLVVLVIPTIIALMQSPSLQVLYGISKHKFFAISNSIEAIANLILSLILVQKLGLMGVALGTAIPMIIIKLFVQPVYTCKVIELNLKKYYLELIFPILFKSFGMLFIFWFLFKKIIFPDYINLLCLISSLSIAFFCLVFFFGLNSFERNRFTKTTFF